VETIEEKVADWWARIKVGDTITTIPLGVHLIKEYAISIGEGNKLDTFVAEPDADSMRYYCYLEN
jgi:hypothetical protein